MEQAYVTHIMGKERKVSAATAVVNAEKVSALVCGHAMKPSTMRVVFRVMLM